MASKKLKERYEKLLNKANDVIISLERLNMNRRKEKQIQSLVLYIRTEVLVIEYFGLENNNQLDRLDERIKYAIKEMRKL
jgi:hypothetical protein